MASPHHRRRHACHGATTSNGAAACRPHDFSSDLLLGALNRPPQWTAAVSWPWSTPAPSSTFMGCHCLPANAVLAHGLKVRLARFSQISSPFLSTSDSDDFDSRSCNASVIARHCVHPALNSSISSAQSQRPCASHPGTHPPKRSHTVSWTLPSARHPNPALRVVFSLGLLAGVTGHALIHNALCLYPALLVFQPSATCTFNDSTNRASLSTQSEGLAPHRCSDGLRLFKFPKLSPAFVAHFPHLAPRPVSLAATCMSALM
ncbi:hypothetical protein C8R45DRAFT_1094720 [Mycena sanguinolenta]|nr:hypothetical protein C8R45DRAFT_1094720 [Mycena sanguinolenta]